MLKSLPTDNLYKTCTFIALSLLITLFSGLFNYKGNVKAMEAEYQKQYAELEVAGAPKATLDVFAEMTNSLIDSKISNHKSIFIFSGIAILFSFALLGFGVAGWKAEQDRQDKLNDQKIN